MNRRWKPGVPRAMHLFAAALFWTAIGGLLLVRGWGWLGVGNGWLLLVAVVLGTLKSLIILDGVVRRSLMRIDLLKDGTCLGAVFSWKTWSLVLAMMAAGLLLRRVAPPGPWLGAIYCAIGWSLCFSSRLGWRQWYIMRHNHEIA